MVDAQLKKNRKSGSWFREITRYCGLLLPRIKLWECIEDLLCFGLYIRAYTYIYKQKWTA